MTESLHKAGHQIVTHLLTAICAGSLAFGGSQMFVVAEVKGNTKDISYLKEADEMIRKEIDNERKRTDDRIFRLAELVTNIINQNREIIELVKTQNQIIARQPK